MGECFISLRICCDGKVLEYEVPKGIGVGGLWGEIVELIGVEGTAVLGLSCGRGVPEHCPEDSMRALDC